MPATAIVLAGEELSQDNTLPMGLGADARTGKLFSLSATLSDTPGTVTTITLPDSARGIRLNPTSDDIQFAVGEDPDVLATSSDTTIAVDTFGVGGIAKGDAWEVRLIEDGTARTLHLASATASVVVTVETF
jgi:hypothetical protein